MKLSLGMGMCSAAGRRRDPPVSPGEGFHELPPIDQLTSIEELTSVPGVWPETFHLSNGRLSVRRPRTVS